MKFSSSFELAHRFDRFSTDVNAIYKKFRKQIPSLKKQKLPDEKMFAEVFVFWYLDEEGNKLYLQS
jgi:hypothetical protein